MKKEENKDGLFKRLFTKNKDNCCGVTIEEVKDEHGKSDDNCCGVTIEEVKEKPIKDDEGCC